MTDEAGELLERLRHGIATLNAVDGEGELAFLIDAGRQQAMIAPLISLLHELVEIWHRARADDMHEGDAFRALRLLAGQAKPDLVRIILELALPSDEEAILPYRMELKRRNPSRRDKVLDEARRKISANEKKRERERSVVLRIMSVRQSTGCTLKQAFQKVAKCEDIVRSGLLAEYAPRQYRSVSAVRADYMAGMSWLKPLGSVHYRTGGIIGGRTRAFSTASESRGIPAGLKF